MPFFQLRTSAESFLKIISWYYIMLKVLYVSIEMIIWASFFYIDMVNYTLKSLCRIDIISFLNVW